MISSEASQGLSFFKGTVLLTCILMLAPSGIRGEKKDSCTYRHTLYAEAGGGGGYLSANYERCIRRKKMLSLYLRGGLGTYNIRDYTLRFNPDLLIPVGAQMSYGKKHNIEAGIGQTFTRIVRFDPVSMQPKGVPGMHAYVSLGYAYRPPGGGLMIRVAYTPLIESYAYYSHWASLAVGFTFR